jgi:hypothetical protein
MITNNHKFFFEHKRLVTNIFIFLFAVLFVLMTNRSAYSQLVHDFKVNEDTALIIPKYYSRIASNNNGSSVVIWAEDYPSTENIFAQIFDVNFRKVNGNFRVNQLADTCFYPDISMRSDGSFCAVWVQNRTPNTSRLKVRIFTKEGIPTSGDITINDSLNRGMLHPRINCDSSGRFIVTWFSSDFNVHRDILFQLLDSS